MNNPEPFSLNQARQAAHDLASARRRAESDYRSQAEQAADAEADYRKKCAAAYLAEEGTVAEREAKVKAATADAGRHRDIEAALTKACLERLKGLEGERAVLRLLMEWSMRIDTSLREVA